MDVKCAICIENYDTEKPPMEIPSCTHIVHEDCIRAWNLACDDSRV